MMRLVRTELGRTADVCKVEEAKGHTARQAPP